MIVGAVAALLGCDDKTGMVLTGTGPSGFETTGQPPPSDDDNGNDDDDDDDVPTDDDAPTDDDESETPPDDDGDTDGTTGGEDPTKGDEGSTGSSAGDEGSTGEPADQDWNATFSGMFSGDSESPLTLDLLCDSGELLGTASDDFGFSALSGTCSATEVAFEKVYIDGEFEGSTNDYVGEKVGDHMWGTWSNSGLSGTWSVDAD